MPQIGPLEILVVSVIALIVFGPRRLPELARQVGRTMADVRQQLSDLKGEFDLSLEDPDERVPGTLSGQKSTSAAASGGGSEPEAALTADEEEDEDDESEPEGARSAEAEDESDTAGFDESDEHGEN